ncbi:MAG: hypothetical protein PHD05_09350, partial [Sphaerochaetaceae bacterium]|nr:hypothetical protein [Sphaerochaetaceae bacterium]
LIIFIVLFSSCVSKGPEDDSLFFQGLGEEGAFVMTSTKENLEGLGVEFDVEPKILNKIDRISVSIKDNEFYGGLEGEFSSFFVNTALVVAKDYKKKGDYFQKVDSSLQLGSPKNNLLIISSNKFDQARQKTVDERVIYIDSSTAELMKAADLAVYSNQPTSLKLLGYDIDDSIALTMKTLLIYFKDGMVYLSADFKDEKSANTFSTVVRASYITGLKKRKEKIDINMLKQVFTLENNLVEINGIAMMDSQIQNIDLIIENFI